MGSIPLTPDISPLTAHVQSLLPQDGSRESLINSVIPELFKSIAAIADALRTSHRVLASGTANSFGDEQLNVDVIAETCINLGISLCPSIKTASNEEDPVERPVQHRNPVPSPPPSEQYTIAFDPLDGSSIIPANWTVGTIISLWDGRTALDQSPRTRQIAAILGVYGPRTTAIIALRVPGGVPACFEVALTEGGWRVTHPGLSLSQTARCFSPANLRAAAHSPAYLSLVSEYVARQYTLRYAGGLVPDVVHMLVQGQGIYLSPATAQSKAKLRRLYEPCPLALVVECAGGKAVDSADGERILDTEVKRCDEREGIVCGCEAEVDGAVAMLVEKGEVE
ncbi:Sedoheptulose-1,7-bisphosphatase, chloroplastic [Madurella mycetomatis]|uniref:Sedoheptulose-1,7-bisphosphatase, chloroplastic n=1 Tax=Madurella mycetomatis TaxID=100816 RepID=A0A175VQH1_9PEZI|nr:Sedoheptulose-1,7-bisphosphatase, chloroplastic [Madurella mycetomatis]